MKTIQFILKNYKAIGIVILIALFMLFLNQCNKTKKLKNELKTQEQKTKQNMAALNDSITVYKNRIGQMSFSKPIAQMTLKELEQYYPDLYKKIQNELGDVKLIYQTKLVYKDTGSVKNNIAKIDSNHYLLRFNYMSEDKTLSIKTKSDFFAKPVLISISENKYDLDIQPGTSTIEDFTLSLGLTTGIKQDKDGLYKIFITPDSKNVQISEIKGADVSNMLSPTPNSSKYKKWSVGPNIGYSMNFSKGTYSFGPSVGISIQYSLFKF